MNKGEFTKLYLLTYLISQTPSASITGYSNFAARLLYLKKQIEADEKLDNEFRDHIRDLVVIDEDDSLDWSGLQNLLERTASDEYGRMFLVVESKSIGPNKWAYEFHARAPTEVIKNKLEEIIATRNQTRFFEKIKSAATIDENAAVQEVYPT